MSDLVGNPEDRFSRDEAQLLYGGVSVMSLKFVRDRDYYYYSEYIVGTPLTVLCQLF